MQTQKLHMYRGDWDNARELTSVVRAIRVLLVGSHLLGLVLSIAYTNEVTVRDTLQSVASSAHLSIHLVATADRGSIVGMHHAIVRPGVLGGVHDIAIGASCLGGSNEGSTTSGSSRSELTQNPVQQTKHGQQDTARFYQRTKSDSFNASKQPGEFQLLILQLYLLQNTIYAVMLASVAQ